jgi:hypothetical protein
MAAVIRRVLLLWATLVLNACDYGPEKEWYKAGGYTMVEFQRDQKECTKSNVLDEECMKERGWIAISADKSKGPPPMHGGPTPQKPQSAPK